MNFQFAIIFGCDYEGENADSLQLLETLNQVDDIIEQEKGWYDYYMIGEIKSNGRIDFSSKAYLPQN